MSTDDILNLVREAFDAGHVEVTRHFWDELRADAFVHADVLCAVDSATRAVDMGLDQAGNPKFEVTGTAADGRILSVICSLKATGALLLITAYEGIQT